MNSSILLDLSLCLLDLKDISKTELILEFQKLSAYEKATIHKNLLALIESLESTEAHCAVS